MGKESEGGKVRGERENKKRGKKKDQNLKVF